MNPKSKLVLLLFSLLLLPLVVVACDNDSPTIDAGNVTYVVVTAAPDQIENVSLQATQVPPNVPAPSATPDIPPDIALQIADRYLLDGYYENAVYSYQILLDQGGAIPPETRAAAAYGQAQAALREGLFASAVDAANTLIAQFPNDFRAVQAYFLRGDAYLGLSQWQNAINDYQQYLILRPGIIDSYVYERIGDAQINLDQFDAALTSYDLATNASRSRVPQAVFMEKVARLHRLNGNVDLAVAQYDGILSFAENTGYRATIEFEAAMTLLETGDLARASIRLERIFNEYETQPEAFESMSILLANNIALDSYQKGRVSFFAEQYEQAIEFFNAYTTEALLTEIPAALYIRLGQSYRAVGNADAARVAFQTIIEQYPNDELFGDALLEQGRTFFLAGEIDEATARYLAIADSYGYLNETAAEALWRAGYLYGTNGNPGESRQVFLRLADAYPNTEQAISGLGIAASAAIAEGDTVAAETLYARLASLTAGADQAEALLQLGLLAVARGDSTGAEQALSQVQAAAPDTYFSARSQDIRNGLAPFSSPEQFVFEFDDLAEVRQAEEWLIARFGVVQERPLWPLSPALEQDERIIRGRELWAMGAYAEANIEFLDIINTYSTDALASYQLAIYMRIIGSYRASIVAAANVIIASGQSTLQVPPYIARMRYPAYYGDEVRRVAEQYGFDPLLMFSLIRHESLFDTNATAAADEKGLTQVIPGTGDYIAEQLAWPDYQHRDLFRPYAGIAFGAYYLDEQLERFDNNVYAALGAYNAGPGRAIDWLALSGGDPDRFMATITISSTRLYIQRIYSHYNIYRQLYGR